MRRKLAWGILTLALINTVFGIIAYFISTQPQMLLYSIFSFFIAFCEGAYIDYMDTGHIRDPFWGGKIV